MATPPTNKGTMQKNEAADDGFATSAPVEAVTVSTGRSMYKPESCRDFPIQGYLIAAEELGNEDSKNGVFTGLIFRLTKKTKTPDAKGNLVVRNVGDEIILPQNYELSGLEEAANNPDEVAEFWVKAIDKETLQNSHTLWHYDVKFVSKAPRAKIAQKTGSIFGLSEKAQQLPPASAGAAS